MKIGKNIGYGLGFFAILGLGVGLGISLSIIMADDPEDLGSIIIALFGIIIFLASGPILAGLVGIVQGAASKEKPAHAAGAGFVTGGMGFLIATFIVFFMMIIALSIKLPQQVHTSGPEDDEDEDDDEERFQEGGSFFKLVIQLLIPASLTGGLAAYISARVFSDPNMPQMMSKENDMVPVGSPQIQ